VVIIQELIPVEHIELYLECALILAYVEEELLIPDGGEGVSDGTGAEDFFAEKDDDKWMHVSACAGHYRRNA
jgi:hypothetical protein